MLDSVSITDLETREEHLDCVLDWLRSEWNDKHMPFANTITASKDRPGAKLALLSATPVGVLSFKRHDLSNAGASKLWVNAVFVPIAYRGRGIARKLVRAAMKAAIPKYADELYAYTDVPKLYEDLGWQCLDFNRQFASFTLTFAPDAHNKG